MTTTTTERIEFLMEQEKITAYKLCKETNIPASSFTQMRKGKFPWRFEYLISIAKYFHVSLDFLAFGEEGILGDGKKKGKYGEIRTVEPILKDSHIEYYTDSKIKIRQVPIIASVGCGTSLKQWERIEGKYEYAFGIGHLKDPFIVIAEGDSMRPYINPGDYLLCADAPERIKSKTAVVVSFKTEPESYEGNAKMVKFLKNDEIMLYSINTKYDPEVYEKKQIYKMFKIFKIIREVK